MEYGKMGGSLEEGLSSKTPCDTKKEPLGPEKDQKPMATKRESVKKNGGSFTIR